MQFSSKISGLLIFLSFLTTLYAYFFNEKVLIILLILSFVAFLISYLNGFKIDFIKVFTVNQYLLTFFILQPA